MDSVLLSSLVEVALLLYLARHVLDELRYEPPHRRHAVHFAVVVAAATAVVLGWFANAWLLPIWPHWRTLNPLTLEPVTEAPATAWLLLGHAVLWIYGAGVLCLFERWLCRLINVWRHSVRARPVTRGYWFTQLQKLDLAGHTRLCVSDGFDSPVAWGFGKPVILLPEQALHWPQSHCDWTLRHELAHIRRHDWLSQQIAYLACVLCWPLTGIWRMYASLRLDAELAADDAVLLAGARATEYGQWLLHQASQTPASAAMAIHSACGLTARLHHLLNRYSVRSLARGHAFLSLIAGLLLAQPLVHVQLGRLTIEPLVLHAPAPQHPEPATHTAPIPTLKLVRELTPLATTQPVKRPNKPPDALHQPIPPPRTLPRYD